jgi:hypothetical protein
MTTKKSPSSTAEEKGRKSMSMEERNFIIESTKKKLVIFGSLVKWW